MTLRLSSPLPSTDFNVENMTFLDKICSALGHNLRDTLIIRESDGFYEVDYAKYCARCGDVEPRPSRKKAGNKA